MPAAFSRAPLRTPATWGDPRTSRVRQRICAKIVRMSESDEALVTVLATAVWALLDGQKGEADKQVPQSATPLTKSSGDRRCPRPLSPESSRATGLRAATAVYARSRRSSFVSSARSTRMSCRTTRIGRRPIPRIGRSQAASTISRRVRQVATGPIRRISSPPVTNATRRRATSRSSTWVGPRIGRASSAGTDLPAPIQGYGSSPAGHTPTFIAHG
jgi:hypothetical protein